jgi:hypothetical protein
MSAWISAVGVIVGIFQELLDIVFKLNNVMPEYPTIPIIATNITPSKNLKTLLIKSVSPIAQNLWNKRG